MDRIYGNLKLFYKLLILPIAVVFVLAVLAFYAGRGTDPNTFWVDILVVAVLVLLIGVLMAKKIVSPIQQIVSVANEIAKGDLSLEVPSDSWDEIGELGQSVEAIRLMMAEVVGQSVSASKNLSVLTSDQAASLEETSSSLEEMTSMTKQNAGNASQANVLMVSAKEVIEKADGSMDQLTGSMKEIGKASEQTQKIVKTIDEIASQTNLLALNAAVEAARAGEAGAGFAVVADEVRSLALRAAEAAKNTSGLMEDIVRKVQNGDQLVGLTNKAFKEITDSSLKVVSLIGEIAVASQEQSNGIEQITRAVAEMSNVTQNNAARAEELASVMSMFKVNGNSSDEAKALAKKAAAFARENGKERAMVEFNDPNGRFTKGKSELYVVFHDMNGGYLSNPWQPELVGLVGRNHLDLQDSTGKYFVREMIDLVKTKGSGWFYYSYVNFDTKKIAPKKGYVQRVEGTDQFVLIPTLMK